MLQGLSKSGAIKSQSGAISLIILLIVVVTATTFLLGKLNAGIKHSVYSADNGRALQEAKDAIISWAVNHPFNPGTLPMPDRNGDGDYDGDADCFNGVINNNLLLGKIPWRDMPSPCKDAGSLIGLSIYTTDKSGQQLWYAVSKNLVYESPDYPFISPGLLSRTTDWITVRDSSGSAISDRVAFVIIAPGPALAPYTNCDALSYAGQSRTGAAPNPDNYLDSVTIGVTTYSNADFDQEFIAYPNSNVTTGSSTLEKCDAFNDQLVYVTIEDFMDAVSNRVLNETGNFLSTYHNFSSALPWLSPYADPKAEIPIINGEADNAAVSTTTLEDAAIDFVSAGVQVGDLVRNITDGSLGVINSVGVPDNNTVTVGSLVLGTNNNFGEDDQYHITPQSSAYINNYLRGAATIGSSGFILEDTGMNFIESGVMLGDIIENFTDGSTGVVGDVTSNAITVTNLTGGTDNDFDNGDGYRIRSNMGVAIVGSGGNILEDDQKNFVLMGVANGDLIKNISDGSFGRVTNVAATTLTVDKLEMGTSNAFTLGDVYAISRYNSIASTSQGLIAYHLPGKYFKSGFGMDWSLNNVTLTTSNTPAATQTEYQTRVQQEILTSTLAIKGKAENATPSAVELLDSDINFVGLGVQTGDVVQNISDGSQGVIDSVGIPNNNTLTVASLTSGTNNTFSNTDEYYITPIHISENDGACVWMKEEHVECYGKTSVSLPVEPIEGVVTSGSNTATFTDSTQSFVTDGVKPGDIIQNFNDEADIFTRTADAGSSGTTLYDVGANFTAYDKIAPNYYELLVRNNATGVQGVVTQIIDNDTLVAKRFPNGPPISFAGGNGFTLRRPQYMVVSNVSVSGDTLTTQRLNATAPDFDVGEYYRIIPSTKIATGTIGLAVNPWMNDASNDFSALGVEIGDIVENVTDGSFGIITFVFGGWIQATLYGGTTNIFLATNSYRVHHGYASSRKYQFSPRFTGGDTSPLGKTVYASTEVRKRGACIGYGTDCLSAPTASTLPYNLNVPLITITDYEDDNDIAATTTATIPNVGTPTGSILVSNIDYYLREGGNEIPEWFVRNRWHQYVMVAYSDGESPGATVCTAGTDCLRLNIMDSTNSVVLFRNDVRALVSLSKDSLSSQSWANANANDYFENLGVATSGSASTTLEDTNKNFIASGISVGDMINNITDGSSGTVQTITPPSTIIATSLSGGINNSFSPGDVYVIDVFYRYPQSATFNDLMRIAVSCPPPNASQLCWSN